MEAAAAAAAAVLSETEWLRDVAGSRRWSGGPRPGARLDGFGRRIQLKMACPPTAAITTTATTTTTTTTATTTCDQRRSWPPHHRTTIPSQRVRAPEEIWQGRHEGG